MEVQTHDVTWCHCGNLETKRAGGHAEGCDVTESRYMYDICYEDNGMMLQRSQDSS